MRPPSRSSKWSWPARSTNRLSAAHQSGRRQGRAGLCGRTAIWWSRVKLAASGASVADVVDLGFVGEPERSTTTVLDQIIGRELIQCWAPIASARTVRPSTSMPTLSPAANVAGALKRPSACWLTDGRACSTSPKLIPELSVNDIRKLIANGTISGGDDPKSQKPASPRLNRAWKALSFSMARSDTPCCSNCSPITRFRHADPQVNRIK